MFRDLVIISIVSCASVMAGYAGSTATNNVGQESSAGGYGYSGSFSGSSGDGVPPNFPDFQNFLNSYFDSFAKYNQQFLQNRGGGYSYSIAGSSPGSSAEASSSIVFNDVTKPDLQQNILNAQNQGGFGAAPGFAGGFGGGFSSGSGVSYGGSFAPGEGGASASAALGPQGIQQTASVFPENPQHPNINVANRFGGGPGTFSVFTSSQSHSSNVNGKPQSFHQASTTVNDNGKVTTYTVKNP